jgi:2-phosphosulfolactate phosphatase
MAAAPPTAPSLRVLFSPAEYEAMDAKDLLGVTCVVFDVLRATSTMLEALGNGATGILPAREIAEALALRTRHPQALLAGERDGLRIRAHLTGGIDFDLGNSPREFTQSRVEGHEIIMTTTNGTRALEACRKAKFVHIASFGNLTVLAQHLLSTGAASVCLVCAGTLENASFEDTLGAGALVDRLIKESGGRPPWPLDDSAQIAWDLYRSHQHRLSQAAQSARNGRRLLAQPELAGDVPVCFQEDRNPHVARLGADQVIRKIA